ncbi:MAG: TlpA family protein disulfide reductase [Acidimicrobiales bacterium]
MTRRRLATGGAVVVVAIVAVLALRPTGDGEVLGRTAPAFSTFDLQGRPVRLADYQGRPVLVNFWASWCVPCRREFPLLRRAEESGRVEVLGVVFQDSRSAAADFMADQGATWPGLVDPDGDIADAYAVRLRPGLPVTVAVAADGRLVSRHVGELRGDDLDQLVDLVAVR